MPGRLRLQEGRPARIESDPSSDQVTTAITRSRRQGVAHITTPSPRQIHDTIHTISSVEGPLPISVRRAVKKAEKAAKNRI